MWSKIRKILGALTDALQKGRELGWWSKSQQASGGSEESHRPGRE